MRQQYHFRQVNGKTHIWNVNKLVKQAASLPIKQILLKDIQELNQAYWFKPGSLVTCNDVIHHMQLVEAACLDYPILLCAKGQVIDGMHRVVKAILLGMTHIAAVQLETEIAPDYIDIDPNDLAYDE